MRAAVLALLVLAQDPDGWDAFWRSFADETDPKLRREAMERVCRAGPPAARAAARSLESRDDVVRRLAEKLDSDDVGERERAARVLVEHGRAAEPALHAVLKGPSAEARARARAILLRIDERLRSGVVTDPCLDFVTVLGRTGGREHLKLVTPLFAAESAATKLAAIDAARRLATAEDLDAFEPLAADPQESVRGRVPPILAEVGGVRARGRLLRMLREETSPGVLLAAGLALARLPGETAPGDRAAILLRASSSASPLRGRLLLETIRLHRGRAPDPLDAEIERALLESDAGTKTAVLPQILPGRPLLAARLLGDPDPAVRDAAKAGLRTLLDRLDGEAIARMAAGSRDATFRSEVRDLLYGRGGRSWGLAAAAAEGDGEIGADAALRLRPGETPPALRELRDKLPAGRSRDIVEAALAEEVSAPAILRLIEDADPLAQSVAVRASANLRLAAAVPRLRDLMSGPLDAVTGVAFDAAGKTLFAVCGERAILAMDLATGRVARSAPAPVDRPASFAPSADRRRALTGHEDGSITLWSLDPPAPVRTWKGHAARINGVAFAPDGRTAAAAGQDGSLALWDPDKAERLRSFTADGPAVTAVAFSADGRRLLSAGHGKGLVTWDVASGEPRREYPQGRRTVLSVVFTDSGHRALAGGSDGSVVHWDLEEFGSSQLGEDHRAAVVSLAISPDGRTVLSGGADGSVVLRDAGSGDRLRSFDVHSAAAGAVAFSPDGRRAASGGRDGVLAAWDLGTGGLLRSGGRPEVRTHARLALAAIGTREAAAALLEILPSLDSTRRAEFSASVRAMPLVRPPEGVEIPPEVARAIAARRELPKLLGEAASLDALSTRGYARLRYEFVKGEPEDAFPADGTVRISEDRLPALATASHAGVLSVLLRNSGTRESPESLRKAIDAGPPAAPHAASACIEAGLKDVLPRAFELGEALAVRATRADPALGLEAVGRWTKGPVDDAKARLVLACAAALPGRTEVFFGLAAHADRRLSMSAAQHLANARSREVFDEARKRHRDGTLPDARVVARIVDPDLTPDDLPLLRKIAEAGGEDTTLPAYRLLTIGGRGEVERVLPVFARTQGAYLGSTALHVGPEHRALIEKLLEAPETKDAETLRYLLLRAGKTEGAEKLLEAPPRGTGPATALVHAVATLEDEALLRRVADLATRWSDVGTQPRIWEALVARDAPLTAKQVETAVRAARWPELRGPLLGWIARRWTPELKGALGTLLVSAGPSEAEDPLRALHAAHPADASAAVTASLGFLLRNRVAPESLLPILSGPGDGKAVAEKLVALHKESARRSLDPAELNLVLAAARGRSDPALAEVVRLWLKSGPLASRMLAAQSLAASDPLPEGVDPAVAAHFRFCRGERLSAAGWASLPPTEASLALGVQSRVAAAARSPDIERFPAAFELLTCREWGGADPAARRDWLLANATRSFDEVLAAALRDAGYAVGEAVGVEDAAELVRALRDRRGPLAANALWALHRWAPGGPQRIESVSAAGLSGWAFRAGAPPEAETAAWEKWAAGR